MAFPCRPIHLENLLLHKVGPFPPALKEIPLVTVMLGFLTTQSVAIRGQCEHDTVLDVYPKVGSASQLLE